MKKGGFLICILIASLFVGGCRRYAWFDEHTYYCKGRDVTFRYLEKDTFDILVFDDSDSIFINHHSHGYYCGIEFHIPEDSDIIYFKVGCFISVYRYVENKYKIKLMVKGIKGKQEHRYFVNIDEKDLQEYLDAYDNRHAWGFYGGWERGAAYSFGVVHNSIDLGELYPLE